jgi:hypothetical protein
MYRTRLVDGLREDFPRVAALLGDAEFRALAYRYLARHRSTHPSVRDVGCRFTDFIASDAALPPFLSDLARLEWARVEVFDASDAEPLRLSDLEALPAPDWPASGSRSPASAPGSGARGPSSVALVGRQHRALLGVPLGLPHPVPQRLGRAGNRPGQPAVAGWKRSRTSTDSEPWRQVASV